ncbi:MAG: RDD family protein [Thermoleophilaceae bacterium]|nr:RDD family protein [Thermoleophilaceae bacterium]
MAAFAKTRASAGPSPSVPTGPQFDNRRVLAGIIDLMVPLSLGLAVGFAGLSLTLGMQVVVLAWALYYCFALESSGGQTLGKRVMKLRVVSADGSPATDSQIAKRTVVRILEWNIIGLIVMLVSGERRQRLGDMVAGTVVTDAVATEPAATTELPATTNLPPSRAPEAPAAVKEPKRRRGLKDLAKLEIGGSKKKAVQGNVAADQAQTAPKKRRSFKELGKIEIGGKKEAAEEPAAVMAAPAHAAEPLPPEALPESLRPEPEPESPLIDPLADPTAPPPVTDREVEISPEHTLDHEPIVEVEPSPMPMAGPEPSVEIEAEPIVEHEPQVTIEPEPQAPPKESLYEHAETDAVGQSEPVVEIDEPGGFNEPEASPYAHLNAEPSPYAHLNAEPEPEPALYQHAPEPEPEPTPEPTPAQPASRYPETEAPGAPAPIVKPIETVSAMDLLMQEVEERQAGSNGSGT